MAARSFTTPFDGVPVWLSVAARVGDGLPAMTAGNAGCLMADDLDPDAIALIGLLDGTPEAWSWHRDDADPVLVVLDRPVLGAEVAAPDPCLLATALEHLADAANDLVPAAQALAERADVALRTALGALLRRDLPGLAAGCPGARFRPAGLPGDAAPRLSHPDVEAHHAPAVEDHRLLRQRS